MVVLVAIMASATRAGFGTIAGEVGLNTDRITPLFAYAGGTNKWPSLQCCTKDRLTPIAIT